MCVWVCMSALVHIYALCTKTCMHTHKHTHSVSTCKHILSVHWQKRVMVCTDDIGGKGKAGQLPNYLSTIQQERDKHKPPLLQKVLLYNEVEGGRECREKPDICGCKGFMQQHSQRSNYLFMLIELTLKPCCCLFGASYANPLKCF